MLVLDAAITSTYQFNLPTSKYQILLRRRGCMRLRCATCSLREAEPSARQLPRSFLPCWKLPSAFGRRGHCRGRRTWQLSCASARSTPSNAGTTTMASSTSRQGFSTPRSLVWSLAESVLHAWSRWWAKCAALVHIAWQQREMPIDAIAVAYIVLQSIRCAGGFLAWRAGQQRG